MNMKKKWKGFWSLLLCLIMVVSQFSSVVAEPEKTDAVDQVQAQAASDESGALDVDGDKSPVEGTSEDSQSEELPATEVTDGESDSEAGSAEDAEQEDPEAEETDVDAVDAEEEAVVDEKKADDDMPEEVAVTGAGTGIEAYYNGQKFSDGVEIEKSGDNPTGDKAVITVKALFDMEEPNKQIAINIVHGLNYTALPGFTGSNGSWTFNEANLPPSLQGYITGGKFVANEKFNNLNAYAGTVIYDVGSQTTSVQFDITVAGDMRFFAIPSDSQNPTTKAGVVPFSNAITVARMVNGAQVNEVSLTEYRFVGNMFHSVILSLQGNTYYGVGDTVSWLAFPQFSYTGGSQGMNYNAPFETQTYRFRFRNDALENLNVSLAGLGQGLGNNLTTLRESDITYTIVAEQNSSYSILEVTIQANEGFDGRNARFIISGQISQDVTTGPLQVINSGVSNQPYQYGTLIDRNGQNCSVYQCSASSINITRPFDNQLTLTNLNTQTVASGQYDAPSEVIQLGGFRVINENSREVNDKVIRMILDSEKIRVTAARVFCGSDGISDVVITTKKGVTYTDEDITVGSEISVNTVTVLCNKLSPDDSIKTLTYRTTKIPAGAVTHSYDMRSTMNGSFGMAYYGQWMEEIAPGQGYAGTLEVYDDPGQMSDYTQLTSAEGTHVQKMTVYDGPNRIRYTSTNGTVASALVGGTKQTLWVGANMTGYRYALGERNAYQGITYYLYQPNGVFTIDKGSIKVTWNGHTYTDGDGITVSDPAVHGDGMVYTVTAPEVIAGFGTSSLTSYPESRIYFDITVSPTVEKKDSIVNYKDIVLYDLTEQAGWVGADSESLQHMSQRKDALDIAGRGPDYLIGCGNMANSFTVLPSKELAVKISAAKENSTDYQVYTEGNDSTIINMPADSTARIKMDVKNNAESVFAEGYVAMFPIPKAGESMPKLGTKTYTFNWTASLREKVEKEGYTVQYAEKYTILKDDAAWKDWTSITDKTKIRMIKLKSSENLPADFEDEIKFDLSIDDPAAITNAGKTNIFAAAIWREMDGSSGVVASQEVALRLQTGTVSGHAYIDNDNSGTYTTGDTGIGNMTVTAYKKGSRADADKLGTTTTQGGTGFYEFVSLSSSQNVDIVFTNPKNPTVTAADSLHFAATTVTGDHSSYTRGDIKPSDTDYDKQDAIMVLPYKVSFVNGGADQTVADVYQFAGGKLTDPGTTLTKTGYTMDYWYKTSSYGTKWDFANDTVTAAMSLYAKATAKTINVTYYNNYPGSEGTNDVFTPTNTAASTAAYDGKLTAPTNSPSYTGYTWDNKWYTDSACTKEWAFATATVTTLSDIQLFAKWTINSYDVTFNANAGTDTVTGMPDNNAYKSIQYKTKITSPTQDPSRTGYIFAGWYKTAVGDNPGTSGKWDFTQDAVIGITTIYAGWDTYSYAITYDGNGATTAASPTSQTVVSPATTVGTLPTAPQKTGHTFVGWFTKDGSTSGDWGSEFTASTTVTAAKTVYAKWTINNYAVTFSANAGTDTVTGMPDNNDYKAIQYNTKITSPTQAPSRTGYIFAGWYKTAVANNPGASGKWDFAQDTVTGTTTIFAGWNTYSYAITYDDKGATTAVNPTSQTVVSPATTVGALPTAPQKTGYTFAGWFTKDGSASGDWGSAFTDSTTVTEAKTVYAKWDEKGNYQVNYETDGGTPTTISPKTGVKWTANGLLPSQTLTKKGYTFGGWILDGTTTAVDSSTKYSELASADTVTSITLKAVWNEKGGYSISYDTAGGTPATITSKTGIKWTDKNLVPAAPTKNGYDFAGWVISGTEKAVDANSQYKDLVTEDTTTSVALTATWTAKTGYTIAYDTTDGTPATINSKTEIAWTAKGLLPENNPTKAGYTFSHWAVKGANPEVVATADSTYGDLAKTDTVTTVTLEAVWNENGTYTVIYDTTGGTPAITSKTPVKWTDTNLLPSESLTKKGYTFDKWVLTGTDKEVTAQKSYSDLAANDQTGSITLKAVWTEKNSYQVTYDTDGGSTADSITAVKWTQNKLLPATDPTKQGYHFAGWVLKKTGAAVTAETAYGTLVEKDDEMSVTLLAKWTEKDHFVIKYDTNGGTPGTLSSKTVKWTANGLLPEVTPVKTGYTLAKWIIKGSDKEVAAKDKYEATVDSDKVETITLQAVWAENSSYTVKYDANGADAEIDNKTNVKWSDDNLLPKQPKRTGYTFDKWVLKGTSTEVTISSKYADLAADDTVKSVTLQAKWTPVTYTVTYDKNGGDTEASATSAKVTYPATTVGSLPTSPTRAGYTFKSWNTAKNGSGSTFLATTTVTADITVYAQWQKNTEVLPEDYENVPAPNTTFTKKPLNQTITPGETVQYAFTGFGNSNPGAVDRYIISDYPPQGLDLVSGAIPAFTKGAGVTYKVTYVTNNNPSKVNVLASGISAAKAYTFKAPKLAAGDYLTAVCIDIGTVPKGFGVGDVITFTFKVAANPPSESLNNSASLSYSYKGKQANFNYGGNPIQAVDARRVVNGRYVSGSTVGRTTTGSAATGDNAPIAVMGGLAVAALLIMLVAYKKKNTAK